MSRRRSIATSGDCAQVRARRCSGRVAWSLRSLTHCQRWKTETGSRLSDTTEYTAKTTLGQIWRLASIAIGSERIRQSGHWAHVSLKSLSSETSIPERFHAEYFKSQDLHQFVESHICHLRPVSLESDLTKWRLIRKSDKRKNCRFLAQVLALGLSR